MRPFVILALPRDGTTLLASALSDHPGLPRVIHEFHGTRSKFWENPYVLSNFWQDWMADPNIVKIHYYRKDLVASARSILLMGYDFPHRVIELPVEEIEYVIKNRVDRHKVFNEKADYSLTYEDITGGEIISGKFPSSVCERLCLWLDLEPYHFKALSPPSKKLVLRNQEEIECLRESTNPLSF